MNVKGKRILILGAGVMQLPAIRAAREMGLSVLVVDGAADPPGKALADSFARIDLKDQAALTGYAKRCKADGGLDGVFTAGTDFSHAVAVIAREACLPGMDPEVALNASVKSRMRDAFTEGGVPSPRFTVAGSFKEIKDDPATPPYPLVVKPVDSMGGRGCLRVEGDDGMEEAISDAVSHSRTGKAIIEEYIDGPEFSVDALVWKGEIHICGLADRHIRFPPHFVEMGHTMPTAYPKEIQDEVLRVFRLGVRALGIDGGAAKGDIKLGADGKARVGEIAARLSGGYMSGWTFPYSSGVELTKAGLRIALGLDPGDLGPGLSLVSAERAWISIPGVVRDVHGLEEARRMECVRDVFSRAAPGDRVLFPRNNVEKCGNVIAVDADRAKAIRCAEAAAASILLRLEAGNPETRDFLLNRGAPYPPDAFPGISRALQSEIMSMPEDDLERLPEDGQAIVRPLSGMEGCDIRDWQGRSLSEAARIALRLAGARFGDERARFGKDFWLAILRGGYQGGAFIIDEALKGRAR